MKKTETKNTRKFPKGLAPMQRNEAGQLNKDCPLWVAKFGHLLTAKR